MEIKNIIKTKISQYLSSEISKKDFSEWAFDVMYKMLRGEILEIKHLETWGIITELTEINSIDDKYCDELIHRVNQMLLGNQNNSYTFFIQFPEKFVKNNLSKVKNILLKYIEEKELSRFDTLELKLITNKILNNPKTLNELLEWQILDLLKLGYDFYDDEESIKFDLKHTVFVNGDKSIELEYLAKIITLLDCYDGKKGFSVHIIFNNGIGNISILA